MNAAAETAKYDAFIREAHIMRSEHMTSAFRSVFKGLFSPITRIVERQRLRAAFAGMDDRLLKDIGLTRSDIEASVDRCVPRRSFGSYLAGAAEAFGSALRADAENSAVMGLNPHLRRDIGAEDDAVSAVKQSEDRLQRIAGGLADPLHSNAQIANDTDRRAA